MMGLVLMALPAAALAATTTVDIQGFVFRPATVTVQAGDSVTWVNADTVAHNAVALDGSWRTPNLLSNQQATVAFETAGTFLYWCSIHPEMRGTVIVVAAPPATDTAPLRASSGDSKTPIVLLAGLLGLVVSSRWIARRAKRT
jgi:plastocyanin